MLRSKYLENFLVRFFYLTSLLQLCFSDIIPYKDDIIYPQHPAYLSVPKFSAKDAPHWSPGKGNSYIDMSRITLSLVCGEELTSTAAGKEALVAEECVKTNFEVLIFQSPVDGDKPWMDYWPSRQFCCLPEMVDAGTCLPEQTGHLIKPEEIFASEGVITLFPEARAAKFSDGTLSHLAVKKSGVYVVLMASCDPFSSPVKVDGFAESMDPYGYLPADLFGNLPFYGMLSCAYVVIGIAWLSVCVLHSAELLPLQMWITAVLALGMIETTVLFMHYLTWNDYGSPSLFASTLSMIFGVTKRAASRVLVLMVSLGYGVVRPSLGDEMDKILYLGATYFLLSLVYTISAIMPSKRTAPNEPQADMQALIVMMLAGIDTTFYIWIMMSLNNILVSLAARRQTAKYTLYHHFRSVLGASLLLSFCWAMYSVFVIFGDHVDRNWEARWTIDALWEVTYLVIFVAIAYLWAPSKNSQRYAYSVELTQLGESAVFFSFLN